MKYVHLLYVVFLAFATLPAMMLCEDAEEGFAVELYEDTFDTAVQKNNHIVMFFAPWCGHCKRLHPLWEDLAEMLNVKDEPQVVVSKVDCTQQQALCGKYEITGYPTLRFFKAGDISKSIKFKGSRDMPSITEFINQQLNTDAENEILNTENKADDKPTTEAEATHTIELTEESLARHISSGNHFVKFYAPWCSHCQRLAPTWDQLSETLQNENSVSISKIDCHKHRPLCQNIFDVESYPTLLWIEDGKKIDKYAGGRDIDSLKAYVDKMLDSAATDTASEDYRELETNEEENGNKAKVLELNEKNFNEVIDTGVNFVKFYAPWCGHCQHLSPIWDQLAESLHASNKDVKIAKVDCTAADNKKLCSQQEVQGYPTLFAYKSGLKQPEYDGGRSLESLESYVNNLLPGHDEL